MLCRSCKSKKFKKIVFLGKQPISSIFYTSKKYRLKIISEWWFGSDFSDLYRSMLTSSNYKTNIYKKKLDKFLLKNINKFQKILDESKSSSEVHLIFKKI